MTVFYDNESASKAIKSFEALCRDNRKAINGSGKALITATMMAYYGTFKTEQIKKHLGNYSEVQALLIKNGILSVDKSTYPYNYVFNYTALGVDEKTKVSDDIAFLFSNALFNMKEYITKYNIKSWNILALVLETTLKTGYSSPYISLRAEEINSVTGKDFNKRQTRKGLVELGFIQEKKSPKRTQCYKLNRRAYLLGANK